MARNVPTDPVLAAMRRLSRAVRQSAHRAFRVPEVDGSPGDDTNLWISRADGRLYWRSADGTIQATGTGGSPAALREDQYATDMAVLPAIEAICYPASTDTLLSWGAGRHCLVRLDTSALPADAEILRVQIVLYCLDGARGGGRVHLAPVDLLSHDPARPIAPLSQAPAAQAGEVCVTVDRVFGRMWRDGIADGFAILPDPADASARGTVTGPATPYGIAPLARVHYQITV